MKKIIKARKKLEKLYLKDNNVTGVDIGYKIKDGEFTDQLTLRIFVKKKVDKSILKKNQIIPKKYKNIETDIIEGEYHFQRNWSPNVASDLKQYEILKGGIQIATGKGDTGTLGMLVKDNKTNRPALLTNRHVFGYKPQIGEPIYQPNEQSGNLIAKIERISKKQSSDNTTYMDAAIALIEEGYKISNEVQDVGKITGINPIDTAAEFEKYSVSKRGRTTQLTHGFTAGMRGTHKITEEGKEKVLYASNCIDISPDLGFHGKFSYSGDSGSVIVDDKNRVMALLFGGSESLGTTTAIPIEKVFDTLDISLLTEEDIVAWNGEQLPEIAASSISTPSATFEEFQQYIDSLGLQFFTATELWIRGEQNANPDSPAFQLNTTPPKHLWKNIDPLLHALDELRKRLNAPIRITSAYRTPRFNAAIGGSRKSKHTSFSALDFTVFNRQTPIEWATALKQIRQEGCFTGGIGIYYNFIHIDVRAENVDWSNLYI